MNLQRLLALLAQHPGAAAHVDSDGDGFPLSVDCNDADPETYPGAMDWPFDGLDQNCDGTFACEYRVVQTDGTVVLMPNELEFTRNVSSPSGQQTLDASGQEVLRFDLRLVHPECPSVSWDTGVLNFSWTDNQRTGWVPHEIKVYDLTDNQLVWGPVNLNASGDTRVYGDLLPSTRQLTTFAVYANLTGLSVQRDDRVWVDIDGASMIWCALNACSDLDTTVTGFSLVF